MHISIEIPQMLNLYLPFFHYIFLTYLGHFFFFFISFFWPHYTVYGILVPQPGIKPMLHAVKAWNPKPLDYQGIF